jgi:hypothetical protein
MRRWMLVWSLVAAWFAFLGGGTAIAAEWRTAPAVSVAPPPVVPEGFGTFPGTAVDVHVPAGEEVLGLRLARHASEAVPRLAAALAVPVPEKMHVFVGRDDAEFHALQPGRAPEWSDATAWPERRAIFLRAPRARGAEARPLGTVFDHEIIHVLLGQAFLPHEPPRWLQEGVAQVYAAELGPHTAEALVEGAASGRWSTLEELHLAFPRDAAGAQVAYAQAGDFVGWWRDTYGEEGVRALIRGLAAGRSIDGAVYGVAGSPLAEVERSWKARLDLDGASRWLVWGRWALVVLFLGAFAAVAYRRRARQRRQLARLVAREEREAAFLDALRAEAAARRAVGYDSMGWH